ncbi:MAG: helix-turn-helix domain-containing protein [Ruminococcaceae bacterium]|nr:helix-turn-helix domain-containing protein [Oscillospiraceae bacterium]
MSVIGQYIKKYRMEKNITQEQLGVQVGVTTQAVSKWERGGTPDAELLPAVSEALGVSIDALFGKEEKDFSFTLVKKLNQMPLDEAYRYAFDLCWAMTHGITRDSQDVPDDFLRLYIDLDVLDEKEHAVFGRIMHDEGMVAVRTSPDFRHLFLLLEPKNGLRANLLEPEALRRVFELLADATKLKLIFYLYTRLNTPIAASLISKNTGLSEAEVDWHMEGLYQGGLVKRTAIAAAEGEIYSYMFNQENAVIPLLCFADEIARQEDPPLLWSFNRTVPIMR